MRNFSHARKIREKNTVRSVGKSLCVAVDFQTADMKIVKYSQNSKSKKIGDTGKDVADRS